jgi:hypothetical protein
MPDQKSKAAPTMGPWVMTSVIWYVAPTDAG